MVLEKYVKFFITEFIVLYFLEVRTTMSVAFSVAVVLYPTSLDQSE